MSSVAVETRPAMCASGTDIKVKESDSTFGFAASLVEESNSPLDLLHANNAPHDHEFQGLFDANTLAWSDTFNSEGGKDIFHSRAAYEPSRSHEGDDHHEGLPLSTMGVLDDSDNESNNKDNTATIDLEALCASASLPRAIHIREGAAENSSQGKPDLPTATTTLIGSAMSNSEGVCCSVDNTGRPTSGASSKRNASNATPDKALRKKLSSGSIRSLGSQKMGTDGSDKENEKMISAERFKTQFCRSYERGEVCPYGYNCMFAHGPAELRTVEANLRDGVYTTEAIDAFRRGGQRGVGQPTPHLNNTPIQQSNRCSPLSAVHAPRPSQPQLVHHHHHHQAYGGAFVAPVEQMAGVPSYVTPLPSPSVAYSYHPHPPHHVFGPVTSVAHSPPATAATLVYTSYPFVPTYTTTVAPQPFAAAPHAYPYPYPHAAYLHQSPPTTTTAYATAMPPPQQQPAAPVFYDGSGKQLSYETSAKVMQFLQQEAERERVVAAAAAQQQAQGLPTSIGQPAPAMPQGHPPPYAPHGMTSYPSSAHHQVQQQLRYVPSSREL